MAIDPCLAARDAAKVTQNVTAVTLTNNKNPTTKDSKTCWTIRDYSKRMHQKNFMFTFTRDVNVHYYA